MNGNSNREAISGSSTTTASVAQEVRLELRGEPETANPESSHQVDGILRSTPRTARHVAWSEDTVDNEFMNKKKSKICCIFTPNSGDYEEESDDDEGSSSSSSSSSSDSDNEDLARPSKGPHNDHDHCAYDHDHHHGKKNKKKFKGKESVLPGPNAYEIQPKYRPIDEAKKD